MSKTFEIRIKRNRTQTGQTTWELIEKWAEKEGRTMPNAIEQLVQSNPQFIQFWEWIKKGGLP